MEAESKYLTTKEVAQFLNLSKSKVNDMVKKGEIPSDRFGRSVRIPKEWLEQSLQNCLNGFKLAA